MSYFMTPVLLLHGLFNTHSPRQNKYFLFLKLKISPILVNREQAFNCFVNKSLELTQLCLNIIVPNLTYIISNL